MPRIYDSFVFFNELDLLEIRLHELDPVVDRFVICEAPVTFKGKAKPLFFKENRDRFAPFLDKIIHIVVDDMPTGADKRSVYWERQTFQRNAIRRGLGDAEADDFIILSDLDEIPRAAAVESAARNASKPAVFSFDMGNHKYYVNLVRRLRWNRLRMTRFGYVRTMERLRDGGPTWRPKRRRVLPTLRQWKRMTFGLRRVIPWVRVPDAGWHFTYLNGPERISEKLHAISGVRPETVTNPTAVAEQIRATLARVSDPSVETAFQLVEVDGSFPSYLVANRERFSHWIADRETFERYGVRPPQGIA